MIHISLLIQFFSEHLNLLLKTNRINAYGKFKF